MMKKTPSPTKRKSDKPPVTLASKQQALALKFDKQITAALEVVQLDYLINLIKKAGGTLLVKHGPVYEHVLELERTGGSGIFVISRSRKPWYKVSVSDDWLARHSSAV